MQEVSTQVKRRVGFAVLLGLACVIALAQIVNGRRHDDDGIDVGIRALEHAATGPRDDREEYLAKAEHAFGSSTGTLVVEPLAIVGLELTGQLNTALGKPDPVAPDAGQLNEQTAARHAEALMARGKPEAALQYLADPAVRAHTGRGLAVLARFAERWARLRQMQ